MLGAVNRRGFHVRALPAPHRTGGPIAFAGVWECWMGPNGEELETAAIVTTEANRTLRAIHHRMPVILAPDAFDFWLDCANVDAATAAAAIAPAPDNLLETYEISTAVNRVANDSPALIERLAVSSATATPTNAALETSTPAKRVKPKKDERQPSLF